MSGIIMALSKKRIDDIVKILAKGEFINGEAFSPSEVDQILKVWRKHHEKKKEQA